MKGGFGCSTCCGKGCEACTRTCTEPHTGTAFETVYTLFFEGAEAGNPSDGYLDATGDSDTSDPYDGMDGTGPWSQTVIGTFDLFKTTPRYPCSFKVSFWRSNFVLGANIIPPPASTLISESITVTNNTISEGAIFAGGVVLQPGESHEFATELPLVPGAGDQSTNDPRSWRGTVTVRAACDNDFVNFEVKAGISWNVKKRQHVLYGIVRECYEEPGSDVCGGLCASPGVVPDELYVTLSNFDITGLTDHADPDLAGEVHTAAQLEALLNDHLTTTLVVPRSVQLCNSWELETSVAPCFNGGVGSTTALRAVISPFASPFLPKQNLSIALRVTRPGLSECGQWVLLWVRAFETTNDICTTYSKSGTASFTTAGIEVGTTSSGVVTNTQEYQIAGTPEATLLGSYSGTFDWEITS